MILKNVGVKNCYSFNARVFIKIIQVELPKQISQYSKVFPMTTGWTDWFPHDLCSHFSCYSPWSHLFTTMVYNTHHKNKRSHSAIPKKFTVKCKKQMQVQDLEPEVAEAEHNPNETLADILAEIEANGLNGFSKEENRSFRCQQFALLDTAIAWILPGSSSTNASRRTRCLLTSCKKANLADTFLSNSVKVPQLWTRSS